MSSRGKKDCPNCNTEIGARCFLCNSCGYHFPSKEIRKDLLEKKLKPEGIKIFTKMGQGKKTCPGCNIIIGAVTKNCPKCNFDFSSLRKEKELKKEKVREAKAQKREEKVDKKEQIIGFKILQKELEGTGQGVMESITYEEPIKLSSKDHAKRILSYGKERAATLLKLHKSMKSWNHVDWDIVEKGLI
jgi:hypothetical protein